MTNKQTRISEICSAIDRASQLYYTPGCISPLSDDEFEQVIAELRELDPKNFRLTRVGPPYSSDDLRNKTEHDIPMGSLDNVDGGIDGFAAWYAKMGDTNLVLSLKMDGASVALTYEDGILVRAVSRGNGIVGEDLTANAIKWTGVPTTLARSYTGTIRGECMLYHNEFRILEESSDEKLSNPRNVGNGIMGRSSGEDNDKLRFVAFNLVGKDKIGKLSDKFKVMDALGFNVVQHVVVDKDIVKTVCNYFAKLEDGSRSKLPFDIDGIVVAVDDIEKQKAMTNNEKDELRPKHSRAVKFTTAKAVTKVLGVTITVGHTGAIIPTAKVEPVFVGGITVDSPLLNNWNKDSEGVSAAHVCVGDVVEIERAGDVIPKITKVLQSNGGEPIAEPETCPACGSQTTRLNRGKEGAMTFCSRPELCPAATQYKIKHYIGNAKKGVGILGVGQGVLDALTSDKYKRADADSGPLVASPADLYRLTADDIESIAVGTGTTGSPIRLGKKRADALIAEIEKAKVLTLSKFLGALGIDLLGRRRVVILAEECGLNTLCDWLDQDKLRSISGDTMRKSISEGIEKCKPLIEELLLVGVSAQPIEQKAKKKETSEADSQEVGGAGDDLPLSGKSFCFTGTRVGEDEVEANGGTLKSGISKTLDYLVQKDATSQSNKTRKAESYGVKIISVATLQAVLAGERDLP